VCSLVVPSQQSTCKSTVKSHPKAFPAYPNVRITTVTVDGPTFAEAVLSCSGASYCSRLAGRENAQELIKQNGRWYLNWSNGN
jgi:hypothetical protein